jgi:GNAT superfamily N-acetyltransferase
MTNIRRAVIEDVTEISAMLLSDKFWENVESYSKVDINIPKGKASITRLINSEAGMVYVAVQDKKIIGVVIGEVITSWCGDDKHSTDYALYVHSKYRHNMIGYKLLKHFAEETKRMGISKFITQLPFVNFNVDSMTKLLKRQGFKTIATVYEKDFG